MKYNLFACALFLSTLVTAQPVHITAFGGFANYQGDLQDKRYTTAQSFGAFGGGILYEFTEKISGRANVTFAKIGADDRFGINKDRNLNFTSKIIDIHGGVEYSLLDIYEKGFTPYIFAGLSFFHFDPYTTDTSGNKVFLQPLGTEGQGFYDNRKKYSRGQLSIPFGGGLKLALGDNIRFSAEVGLRITSTDYLDDVSTTLADRDQLIARNGPKAAELAFRGNELKTGLTYPDEGAKRGSPESKDWYYFTGLTVSYRIHQSETGRGGTRGLGCPRF